MATRNDKISLEKKRNYYMDLRGKPFLNTKPPSCAFLKIFKKNRLDIRPINIGAINVIYIYPHEL